MIEKQYSPGNIARLFCDMIYTRLFWPAARLVRYPATVRGRRYLRLDKGLTTGRNCRIEIFKTLGGADPILKIGKNVQLNDNVHICALKSVEIGDDVLMASNVYVSDNSHGVYAGNGHHSNPDSAPIDREYEMRPVRIGNKVWIGEGVIILPGVEIGDGAVIGAHAVVNTGIPAACIAVGAPARIVKRFNPVTGKWKKTNTDGSFKSDNEL